MDQEISTTSSFPKCFLTERFIVVIKTAQSRNKVMQIMFSKKDGSVFINFPYYKFSQGLVSLVTFSGNIKLPTSLNLVPGGKVTSHLVKYSHHPDGRAHFSQDGRVRTKVKKKAIALFKAEGHIFTAQLQGMNDFEATNSKKDVGSTLKRTAFEFKFAYTDPEAIKIVGRWYSRANLLTRLQGEVKGPVVPCITDAGKRYLGVLIANPYLETAKEYALLLTCEAIPALTQDEESALTFIAGFDSPEIVNNTQIDTTFLALSYPVKDFSALERRIGTTDFIRNPKQT